MDLDVVFDPQKQAWRGKLRDEWFSGNVELKRPLAPHVGFPIIGDWIDGNARSGAIRCLHVALGSDDALVIWSDSIDLPGFLNYARGDTLPPKTTPELFFTGTDLSGDVVLGKVAADGATFTGSSAHFGNGYSTGAFDPFVWRRSTSDCATSS